MGLDSNAILELFFEKTSIKLNAKNCTINIDPAKLVGSIAEFDILTGKDVIASKGRRINAKHKKELEAAKVTSIQAPFEYLSVRLLLMTLLIKKQVRSFLRLTLKSMKKTWRSFKVLKSRHLIFFISMNHKVARIFQPH